MQLNSRVFGMLLVFGLCFSLMAGTGCVSAEEHAQLKMAHTNLQGEKEQCETELFECRSLTDSLRTKLEAMEESALHKQRLMENLNDENGRLIQKVDELTAIVENLSNQNIGVPQMPAPQPLPPELDNALKRFAEQHPDSVVYDSQRGVVKWSSDLLFALGSDVLKNTAKESLKEFAQIINSPAASEYDILVVGHTDNLPISREVTRKEHPSNWHLSAHRAISVEKELEADGVGVTRVGIMGLSEYHPVADNASDEGRSQNRRVEIYIVQTGTMFGTQAAGTASPK